MIICKQVLVQNIGDFIEAIVGSVERTLYNGDVKIVHLVNILRKK